MTVVQYIYINGYPSVGKLTVAKELQKLFPGSQVLDFNTMINMVPPTDPVDSPNYIANRTRVRSQFLDAAANLDYTQRLTWIFTDVHYADAAGQQGAKDYQKAAHTRGIQFWPVVLECETEENVLRLGDKEADWKATVGETAEGLRRIREEKRVYSFGAGDEEELRIDITEMMPDEAARRIFEHINKVGSGEQSQ
ncbi:hypothetical protein F5X68DRAFT_253396 [Plectosphaerella plurivora]|uniref:P-loop containing nucleoside triphosphate hydrolase protein n=1 Tax=Plectosphaerella plurivora TaxID=936078 RepID=A0A9P9ACF1_9PEZI|nr:hypothetical protein F5X68DRAFT_253396 [Plectosphaerella plurivora]